MFFGLAVLASSLKLSAISSSSIALETPSVSDVERGAPWAFVKVETDALLAAVFLVAHRGFCLVSGLVRDFALARIFSTVVRKSRFKRFVTSFLHRVILMLALNLESTTRRCCRRPIGAA